MSLNTNFVHLKIPLENIQSATNNFADENIIGQGGFGGVYKGKLLLPDGHQLIDIAARRLDRKYGQGSKEFWTEISLLSSLKHSNVVTIVGFCDERGEQIIVHKYEARGSLDRYLSDPTLTWLQRLQICLGFARALSYIHYDAGRDFSIIHRNIKSSKVLLSDDWEPKLSGYGLSIKNTMTDRGNRLLLDDVCGTLGYVDPTYVKTGFVSHKSDIYSFGVVLFEVLCGRKVNENRSLAGLAKSHYEKGTLDKIIHPDLREQIDPQSFRIFSETAYVCLNEQQSLRPDVDQIVKTLEKALEFQLKQEIPEHSISDLEVEDILLKGNYFEHLKIPLEDIKSATDNFSERYLIGRGPYSSVYKCKLPNTEKDVVIKRISTTANTLAEQGFIAEIEVLIMIKHPNIISLVGYCEEGPHMILVLEYASKGSLDDLLMDPDHMNSFSWDQRIQICLDIAHGLDYLHTRMDDKNVIIHRDIKSGNILLDENGKAKIADFGLSKLQSTYKKANTNSNFSNSLDRPLQDSDITKSFIGAAPLSFGAFIHTDSNFPNSVVRPLDTINQKELHDVAPSFSDIAPNYSNIVHRNQSYDNIPTSFNGGAPLSIGAFAHLDTSTLHTDHIAGTLMYLDPEYRKTGRLKKESDIYSFGVVLFEVLCGRLAYDAIYTAYSETGLASIARRRFVKGKLKELIDPNLKNNIDGNISVRNYQASLDIFAKIAYQCVAETQAERPRIEVVIKELEKALNLTSGKFADLQIPLEEIVKATNNFHEENFIGRGTSEDRFYKGLLMRSEKRINVVARKFNAVNGKEIEFWTEISMLSSFTHSNLVSLVGFCLEKSEKIIIYNNDDQVYGTLDQLLLSDPTFTWPRRLKVCLGVADALRKIHYDVVHCDINSSKIFVDKDWEAKVFGFELSTKYPENWRHRLLCSRYFDTSSSYKDPVYVKTKSVIPKYDVYSFGVILFEVLYGRKANGLIIEMENATAHYRDGKLDEMVDSDLRKQMDSQSLKIFLETACHCLEERVKRPTMGKVFKKLEDAIELQLEHDNQEPSKLVDKEATTSNNLKEKMVIPLDKLSDATDKFNPTSAVAYGGFGLVFRAELNRSDIPSLSSTKGENESPMVIVAVKQIFSRPDDKGEKGYLAEIELLTSCKHKNIVSLLGYCQQDKQMILVYEYAFKGSLGDYFCKPPKQSTNLTWVQRLKICLDIARGLEYLHTDMDGKQRIIHRDIKSDNILLDKEMNAIIADFGLSKAQPKNQETFQTQYAVGTSVYRDPEFVNTNKYKKESDTYSFGVVLFEILSGTLAYDPVYVDENKNGLAHIARRRFIDGTLKELIDPRIIEEDQDHIFTLNRGPNQDSFDTFSNIALKCLAETQANRPTIDVVIDELQKAIKFQGETMVLRKFQPNDIESAIKSSAKTNSIGCDASGGIVSKATLHLVSKSSLLVEEKNSSEPEKEPMDVAIKHISSREDGQGDQQGFFEEIDVLTRCKHENIVSLLGFCDEGREMYLVFEDASNGTIDDYLRKTNNKANLTWGERLKWCLNIALGLDHLHTKMGGAQGIVHGDIKSANVLIGKNLAAKIAYYGLSKPHQANQVASGTNNSVDTNVYLDPEYEKTRTLNKKSDVFSFGVVLFELFCGRLAYDPKYKEKNDKGLAPIVRQCFNDGTIKKLIDPELKVENDEDIFTSNRGPNQDSLNKFLDIAIKCLEETPAKRPTMKFAIRELKVALRFQEELMSRLQIEFKEIQSGTKNFSNNVGSGGCWKAYKGDIKLPQAQINAKSVSNVNTCSPAFAKRWDSKFSQGGQQFLNELKILFRYKHENIIGLAGYCYKEDEKILVYENASKGSLDKSLNNTIDLQWIQRLRICIDVASGLEFLHGGAITLEKVVHSNIRSSNILLTGDWRAKISNLELSAVHAYDQDMEHVIKYANGSLGYLSPEYKEGSLTSDSDIYSFGVVLFEILCGRLAWQEGSEGNSPSLATLVMNHHGDEEKLDEMVLEGIRKQAVPESLKTVQRIALQSLHDKKDERPKASEVVKQLRDALELQEDHDIWKPKLPSNYKEIIDMSKDPDEMYYIKKKDLYEKLITEGIFLEEEAVVMSNMKKDFNKKKKLLEGEEPLHEGKVWFSLPRNAKNGSTLISATTFSYGNRGSHKSRTIQKSTARFNTVVKMTDISDLKIKIKLKTMFLALDVLYGVYLVFKFSDRRQLSGKPMYVNLKYQKGSETLHAHFARRRDDAGWMTIELDRFQKQQEDTDFEVFLESFQRCYSGSGSIDVQGIEFRAINNMKETEKLKGVQQVPELNVVDQVQQLTNNLEETSKISVNGELSWWEVDGKKHLMISPNKVLSIPKDIEHLKSKPSTESRFQYVTALPRRQVFRIKYNIDSKMLSPFSEYACYLVFKLSEKCHGLLCPVKVQDRKNKDAKILYFRTPALWNQHDAIWFPKHRKDGWMEVMVWKLSSKRKLGTDSIPMNLKLISYEGTMSGLIVCGLEFRPT